MDTLEWRWNDKLCVWSVRVDGAVCAVWDNGDWITWRVPERVVYARGKSAALGSGKSAALRAARRMTLRAKF